MKNKQYKEYLEADLPEIKYPVNTVQYNEIREVSGDGIFKVGDKKYSKSFEFSDTNYMLLNNDVNAIDSRADVLTGLASLYKTLGCDAQETIAVIYQGKDAQNPCNLMEQGDGYDELRAEYNAITESRMVDKSVTQTKRILTLAIEAASMDIARRRFNDLEMAIAAAYERIGSELKALNLSNRMNLLYTIQNPMADERDFTDLQKKNVKETLALKSFKYGNEYVKTVGTSGEWLVRVFYIKEYPDLLDDDFLTNIIQNPYHMVVSKYMRPLPSAVSKELMYKQLDKVRHNIDLEQDQNNRAGRFRSKISYTRMIEQENIENMISELANSDERMFITELKIAVWAKTEKELEFIEENLLSMCREKSVELARHTVMLREAYVSALPIGLRLTKTKRLLNSASLAGLNPFYAEDLSSPSEENLYYGVNHYTKRLIAFDRRTLSTPHGVVVGRTGSGKSQYVKTELLGIRLNTLDDIIILDPQCEYMKLCEGLGGTYYDCSNASSLKFNPLAINDIITDEKIVRKQRLMNGILATIMKDDFRQPHQDTLEKAIRVMYENCKSYNTTVLQQILDAQPEDFLAAKELSLALNRLVEGTLNIFDDNNSEIKYSRITVFGLGGSRNAEDDRTTITMMVILDYITARIQENFRNKVTSRIYIDEMQRVMNFDKTAEMLSDFWQTTRKLRAVCTGITPSVRNLTKSAAGRNIVDSTGYKVIFQLEKASRDEAEKLFELSQVHVDYLKKNNQIGSAVLVIDKKYYQMESKLEEFEKKTKIYNMISTNPYES